MMTHLRAAWQREIALPLALLVIPVLLSLVSYGEWLNLSVPISLAIGFALRPKHLWPIWIGAILLVWATYGVAELIGALPAGGGGETVWSFLFETVLFMAGLALLPLWLGRLVATLRGGRRGHSSA